MICQFLKRGSEVASKPVVQDHSRANQIRPILGALRLAAMAVDAELEIHPFAAIGRRGVRDLPVGSPRLREKGRR